MLWGKGQLRQIAVQIAAFSDSPEKNNDEPIKIVNINVNGFRSRLSELRQFMNSSNDNIVYAFNDTRLTSHCKNIYLPGYQIISEAALQTGPSVSSLVRSK